MSAICIIPARGGSVRIPRKNIKLFHGKPIIVYSIENALQSGLFDKVVVSSDDQEILNVAGHHGAYDERRAKSDGSIGTQEETTRVLMKYPDYEFACCLYATAPLLDTNDLRRALGCLRDYGDAQFAFGVGREPLRDAGQFYFGRTSAFANGFPLISPLSCMIPIDERRVCDINTPDDWSRAEKMYEALHA